MHFRKFGALGLVLILCLATAACAQLFRNYGRITPSDEVGREFEAYRVHPEYRYYVTGPHISPNAVMGLDRNYQLDPDTSWREVAMTPFVLRELIQGMKGILFSKQGQLHGFRLLDNERRPIGVWYSVMQARTFLKMNSNGTVRIDTPPMDIYEMGEEDSPYERRIGRAF